MLTAKDLTRAETWLVDRRRRGLSIREAAREEAVTVYCYQKWERGGATDRRRLGRLRPHEACFIMRRRFGMSVRHLAELLGVSAYWVSQMERGKAPVRRLVEYWWPSDS